MTKYIEKLETEINKIIMQEEQAINFSNEQKLQVLFHNHAKASKIMDKKGMGAMTASTHEATEVTKSYF